MITFKTLTIKNFLSIGNVTQTINLDKPDLTLILGENLDLGGDGNRNGAGKCVSINTVVKLRNSKTGEVFETTVGELYEIHNRTSNPRYSKKQHKKRRTINDQYNH